MTSTSIQGERRGAILALSAVLLAAAGCGVLGGTNRRVQADSTARRPVLTGTAALGDWSTDEPGVRRRITVADLPAPYATRSVDNGPHQIARPENAWPKAPAGFKVDLFATGLQNPRATITAPNGDIFVAESQANRIHLLRAASGAGKAEQATVFAEGLDLPFGLAFYPPGPNPQWLYVGNTGSVVRIPYRNGDTRARGRAEMVISDIPSGGRLRGGGHWTRDLQFSRDGRKLYVSVGSRSNVSDDPGETRRACVLEFNPDGTGERIFASGIRNAVGLALHPVTGELWGSVNERDELGDHLPPDYITSIKPGGFYGWPWYYIGGHQDPRHPGKHPELREKVIVPDVLVQSHSASLDMCFYTGSQFPREFRGDAFAAEHGSWNRARRTGYKVIRVPFRGNKATGEYEDFLTGFVTPEGDVWGRPVGVTVARDGALIVTDDGGNCVWRASYAGH